MKSISQINLIDPLNDDNFKTKITNSIHHMINERKNYHKKNVSSVAITSRTKKTSRSKSKQNKQEKEAEKKIQSKLKKRMSFQSPHKKQNSAAEGYQNFTLLNYILLRQKSGGIAVDSQTNNAPGNLSKNHFKVLQILGKGGFGRVMKVQFKKNGKIYAMKQMSKTVIITKKSIKSVLNERQLLSELRHPYIVNMIFAFQDRANLYLIMDIMPGGDLRYQIGKFQKFPEHIVKFFVCCILLGLQYLHNNNVIHRDIKPQNLVIDKNGYLRLTDMGIARAYSKDNYSDTSGTPGYMAPQVINRQNHSFAVDFFALGVIAYECMLGKRPYRGYSRQEIRQQILLYEAQIKKSQIPPGWNPQSANLINCLLKRKQQERLGNKGIQQIMNHPWFSDIDWKKMISKKYPSPFMPNLNHQNYDTVSESQYDDQTLRNLAQNQLLLKKQQVQDLFSGYEYEEVRMT